MGIIKVAVWNKDDFEDHDYRDILNQETHDGKKYSTLMGVPTGTADKTIKEIIMASGEAAETNLAFEILRPKCISQFCIATGLSGGTATNEAHAAYIKAYNEVNNIL